MTIKKVIIVFGAIIAFIIIGFLGFTGFVFIYRTIPKSSLGIKQNRIHIVSINAGDITFKGGSHAGTDVEITDKDKIKDAIETLNSIKVYSWKDSLDESEAVGDSPLAWVSFCNKRGEEILRIDFYGEILWYDGILRGGYYNIDITEYDKLYELCHKYGEIPLE